MAEPVTEVVEPRLFDGAARDRVDRATFRIRLHGRERVRVRLKDRLVLTLLVLARRAEDHRAGQVAAVTIDAGTEVEQHEVTLLETTLRGCVMDVRAERAGAHDGLEADLIGAVGPHEDLELERDVPLACSRPQAVEDVRVGVVPYRDCRAERLDLGRFLDAPLILDGPSRADEVHALE